MILVTGGTGFIGQALLRHLYEAGHQVRTLVRPSLRSPNLPRGVPIEVAVCGLDDERGLRAAMIGVDAVYHLAGDEWRGARSNLLHVDIKGTQAVVRGASEAGVRRFFYVSHLGSDRASAYPVLKAKAIAEEHIRNSSLNYTILRSAVVYGRNDSFTTGLARLLHALPFFFIVPGDGKTLLQPLWVEDLVTCLMWALDNPRTEKQTYEIGGPEYLQFVEILERIMETMGTRRRLLLVRPPYVRGFTVLLEHLLPALPVSVYWLDYLASNRTCSLDTIPRTFNLLPARFSQRLAYLRGHDWRRSLIRTILKWPTSGA